ncbi:probable inactive purple acid phosphatase 1 [Tanacetum coccineum]
MIRRRLYVVVTLVVATAIGDVDGGCYGGCDDGVSFNGNTDSGGECGVVAHTMFCALTDNRDKPWYDYGMFRFCIADREHDWREEAKQYKFI